MTGSDLIAGRYELEELVGEGGMASVYRAYDTVLERRVAIKVLHERYSEDAEHVERFRREARAIARLAHPNVVTVIDRGEWNGRQFIVFEHVAGENLKAVVKREGALPVARALALVHQVAQALAYAHELEIVHRDVKPHNVLLDADGVAKVADFGIARALDLEDGLTQTGTVLGTGHYLSPEQASGERADERSDQYSVGVLAFELLTGRVPYDGDSLVAVAQRHVHDPVPSVRAVRPDVPARVDAVVTRSLAKRPEDRFPSMEALVGALEACLAEVAAGAATLDVEDTGVVVGPGVPMAAAPAPHPAPPPRRRRRRRRRLRVAGVVLFLVLAAAGGALAVELLTGEDGLRGLPGAGGGAGEAVPVELSAVADFDPAGGDGEHPEAIERATDGDPATFWTTETYRSFTKPGVGIVLDAGSPVALTRLVLTTDEPGFTAVIRAGEARDGPFRDVSTERPVGERTAFELDMGGEELRYYLVWITDPNGRAHVNEVRASASG